jgi:hypothetical protein
MGKKEFTGLRAGGVVTIGIDIMERKGEFRRMPGW